MAQSDFISPSAVDVVTLSGQQLTDTETAYTETVLDARGRGMVSYILKMATQNGRWTIYGANDSSFAAEVVVQAETTVLAGATGSFSTAQAVFNYYRVKLRTAVAGVQGLATIYGTAKK